MGTSQHIPTGAHRYARPRPRQHRRVGVVIAVLIVVVVAVGVGAWMLGKTGGFGYDPASKAGQLATKTPEEVQAELDRVVDEGMFNISIASIVDFSSPDAPGTANIENVPANHYDMQVDIVVDDTGETVYSSGPIAPGNYIDTIQLARALSPGNHTATATFSALDRDTHAKVGQAGAQVILAVGKG